MRSFEYVKPTTVAETAAFLVDHADDALIMGGGTAAVVLLHLGVVRPRYVVDLSGVDALRQTTLNGALHLGALVSVRSLELDRTIAQDYNLLSEAASQVANVRVRNAATIGGAVAYGEPQTDTPVALTALDAEIEIAGLGNTRYLPISEFYRGPYETVLEPGEFVVGVSVPKPSVNSVGCHMKFTIGSPENKPVANASALITLDPSSGKITGARLVLGAVGATPVLATSAAGLIGEIPNDKLFAEIASQAAEETDPIEDLRGPVWYKRRIARVYVERALKCALQKNQSNLQ